MLTALLNFMNLFSTVTGFFLHVVLMCQSLFSGFLLWKAEGQREHHAESEAGGHPEGLRQTVTSPAGQSDGTNQPFNQPPSCPVIDLSAS